MKRIRFYLVTGGHVDAKGKGFNSCSHKLFGVRLKKATSVLHAICCVE